MKNVLDFKGGREYYCKCQRESEGQSHKTERGNIMANKEMTRAQALEFALEILSTYDDARALEAYPVLEKMHAQVTKPRKKSDAPSKARLQNEALAAKCIEAMEGQEGVTSKWLIEHVDGLMTPQKATAVMKIAVESGAVIRSKDGKTVSYSLA